MHDSSFLHHFFTLVFFFFHLIVFSLLRLFFYSYTASFVFLRLPSLYFLHLSSLFHRLCAPYSTSTVLLSSTIPSFMYSLIPHPILSLSSSVVYQIYHLHYSLYLCPPILSYSILSYPSPSFNIPSCIQTGHHSLHLFLIPRHLPLHLHTIHSLYLSPVSILLSFPVSPRLPAAGLSHRVPGSLQSSRGQPRAPPCPTFGHKQKQTTLTCVGRKGESF